MKKESFYIPTPKYVQGITMLEDAFHFAMFMHGEVEQRRDYTNEPYIIHPVAVGEIIYKLPYRTTEMIAAALLHDTVEDTDATIERIKEMFGDVVASYVAGLTKVAKPEDGNRETRDAINRKHTAEAPGPAQTVKVADVLDNTKDIMEHDPDFGRMYLKSKLLLLSELKGADAVLKRRALDQIEELLRKYK